MQFDVWPERKSSNKVIHTAATHTTKSLKTKSIEFARVIKQFSRFSSTNGIKKKYKNDFTLVLYTHVYAYKHLKYIK